MVTRNSEEIIQNNIEVMGESPGMLHYHAVNEWCDLHLIWKQFSNLFCKGKERVDLLNRCGANFFYTVDRLFFQAAILSICRLSDPTRTLGKSNLTVLSYADIVSADDKSEIDALLDDLKTKTEFARDWRNRHIGHNDLALLLGTSAPLKEATIDDVENSIDAIFAVINFVQMKFFGNAIHNVVVDSLNNEMATLNRLFHGDKAHHTRMENLRNHIDTPNDEPKWLSNSSID
ncbi:hypothetical protein F9K81_11415 [Brucella anthropi]|uniref:AbiU2 domain-containing protein n=1 Tax=Brucella anthropi TaxID=529 RepID=UPI00124BCFBB|nr:hypothetical protein [Brucella anthropi]KAB2757955.1 hypothetical protein F9K81_11415 [Brucella anthropi]